MEKSFASLLRHSKLATYDRRLNQVYVSPKQTKKTGDWGLKRTLPTVIRTPYVTISDLDTVEHQTPWESGHSQVAFLQRWKENFGHVPTSGPMRQRHDLLHLQPQRSNVDEHYNLAAMTRSQFNQFIKHTITPETVQSLQQALETNQITRDQVYDYLNVSFRPERSKVMGPIYGKIATQSSSNKTNGGDLMVEGRILNAQKGGYAVGIGGVVALLPKRYAVGVKKPGDRLLVRQFYVRRAYIDDQGKPQVIVSLQPKSETTSSAHTVDINLALSSPTSALPSSSSPAPSSSLPGKPRSRHWTTATDGIFATAPPNNIDDLQLFLLGQDNVGRIKRTPFSSRSSNISLSSLPSPSLSSSQQLEQHNSQNKTKKELQQDHAIMMNRIITLLKNGTPNKT